MGKTIFFSTKRRENVRGTKAFRCIVPSRPASRRPSVPSRPVPSRPVPSRPVPEFSFLLSRPVPSRPVPRTGRDGTGRDGTVLVPHPAELWDRDIPRSFLSTLLLRNSNFRSMCIYIPHARSFVCCFLFFVLLSFFPVFPYSSNRDSLTVLLLGLSLSCTRPRHDSTDVNLDSHFVSSSILTNSRFLSRFKY